MTPVWAIDCDLRTSYCVGPMGVGRGPTPLAALVDAEFADQGIVLFEIASYVSFNRGAGSHAAMGQLAKWALWNVAQAAMLHQQTGIGVRILVSPSNVWTRGYALDVRHKMAIATEKKKDLREAEAMLWFYAHRPQDWVPLPDFLASF